MLNFYIKGVVRSSPNPQAGQPPVTEHSLWLIWYVRS